MRSRPTTRHGILQAGPASDEVLSPLPSESLLQADRTAGLFAIAQVPSEKSLDLARRSFVRRSVAFCATAIILMWAACFVAYTHFWDKSNTPYSSARSTSVHIPEVPFDVRRAAESSRTNTRSGVIPNIQAAWSAITDAARQPAGTSFSESDGSSATSSDMLSAATDAAMTHSGNPSCPQQYPRMTVKELKTQRCYLFGGQPSNCKECRRGFNETSRDWVKHHPCELWSQTWAPEPWGRLVCPTWMVNKLHKEWLSRKWIEPLQLTPCDLWRFLGPSANYSGRTLWVVGDSQGQSMYDALKCFLHAFLTNVNVEDPFEKAPFAAANLTRPIMRLADKVQPKCKTLGPAGDPKDGQICFLRLNDWPNAIKPLALPFLAEVASHRDILVMNTGLHFSSTYEADLKEFAEWYVQNHRSLPFVIWKDTPPQHFDHVVGEYPAGTHPPFSCKPHAQGYLNVTADHSLVNWYDGTDQSLTQALHSVSQGGWRNKVAQSVLGNIGLPMSLTWNETQPLYLFHRSNGAGYECTHYCMPSAPQVWIHGLVQTLRSHVPQLNAHLGAQEFVDIAPSSWPH